MATDLQRTVSLLRAGLDVEQIAALLNTSDATVGAVLKGVGSLPSTGGGAARAAQVQSAAAQSIPESTTEDVVPAVSVSKYGVYLVTVVCDAFPAPGAGVSYFGPHADTLYSEAKAAATGNDFGARWWGRGSSDPDLTSFGFTWTCTCTDDGTVSVQIENGDSAPMALGAVQLQVAQVN